MITTCKRCKENKKIYANGLCSKCYQYEHRRKRGLIKKTTKPTHCTKCDKAETYCRGLCRSCYQAEYRKNNTASLRKKNPYCKCGKKSRARGLCKSCYYKKYHSNHYELEDYGGIVRVIK